nr:MAG TPA: hypothetical protein [Caudoviricetes sp.]
MSHLWRSLRTPRQLWLFQFIPVGHSGGTWQKCPRRMSHPRKCPR